MTCWDNHKRTGLVANADPRGPVPYDRTRAYHARVSCDRPRCIAAHKGQVRRATGEPGIYFPDPEKCGTCGHQHAGPDLGGICVGCACGVTR